MENKMQIIEQETTAILVSDTYARSGIKKSKVTVDLIRWMLKKYGECTVLSTSTTMAVANIENDCTVTGHIIQVTITVSK